MVARTFRLFLRPDVTIAMAAFTVLLQAPAPGYADEAPANYVIAYRLPKTKTMHFDDAKKAKAHAETVKSLGCEVKQESHSGHIDVSYRVAAWKELPVATDELADQWEGWLEGAGFEAIHGHDHAAHGGEAVEYRSEKWLTQHFDSGAAAAEFTSVCKALGCETKGGQHDGHYDVQFRSTAWKHLEAANHDAAHTKQEWLKKLGFETKHAH